MHMSSDHDNMAVVLVSAPCLIGPADAAIHSRMKAFGFTTTTTTRFVRGRSVAR